MTLRDNTIRAASESGGPAACWLPVEGTADATGAPIEHVGVDHRRADVIVAEQFLDGADVVAVFEQVCGEGMTESMRGRVLADARGARGRGDDALDGAFMKVMAA